MKTSRFFFILFVFSNFLGISQKNKELICENNSDGSKMSHSVSGNIFMGDNLLLDGKIFLIKNSKGLTATVSNAEVSNGEFIFENVDFNEYSLYVIPNLMYDFLYFPKYLPTYLGDVCNWENAFINSDGTRKSNQDFNIHLRKYSEPFYGHGEISGKINYGRLYNGNKTVPVSILLLNSEKIPMDYRVANKGDGSFLFEYLPDGKYYIHPEMPGFIANDFEVIVNSRNVNRVNFRINENSIEKEKVDNKKIIPIITQKGLKVFIDETINSSIICELTDLSGKIIYKKMFSSNEILINTINMTTGIYLLRVRTYNNSIVKTSKVFINNK